MYRQILLFSLALMIAASACGCKGANGKQDERLVVITIHSAVLGKDMTSHVYLPEAYDAGAKYPVLYFLPSNGGSSYTVISQFGVMESVDDLTRDKRIEPMIIVALGIDNSFGMNTGTETKRITTASGKTFDEGMYEDYIITEAIPYVDERFGTDTRKEKRYIGGYSMGGLAALHVAFRHPDLFSRVGGHSPSLFSGAFYDETVSDWLYPTEAERAQRDPIHLARSRDLSGLTVYLDTDDEFPDAGNADGCRVLHETLAQNGIPAENHLFPGRHGFAYCQSYMSRYLLFYGGDVE